MPESHHAIIQLIQERISAETFEQIMDHYYSNVFVTDGTGKILYTNRKTAEALECPRERMMHMTVQELQAEGYTSRSLTDEAIRTRAQAVGSYYTRSGKKIATVSTPVFDRSGALCMVVTYSEEKSNLDAFLETLKRVEAKYKNARTVSTYLEQQKQKSIIVLDDQMRHIYDMLDELAQSDSTIMLYGESGVGKDVAANYIQANSRRSGEIMVPVNCAAIPKDLVEAELFGYEKGAFTGANTRGKIGLFELANEGTLFLDEIGELPLTAQAKLLRVLETGEFYRVGGTKQFHTDVRIIGATNRDLKALVEKQEFREDLYYRLNVLPIAIPPLRERPKDLDGLIETFLNTFNQKYGTHRTISLAFLEELHRYPWPGNIRELRNTIEGFVLTGREYVPGIRTPAGGGTGYIPTPPAEETSMRIQPSLRQVLDAAEARYIRQILRSCSGNVAQAAGVLGIHPSVLYKKMKKAGIRRHID